MVDGHRDAALTTVGLAVKRLWVQFQLDGFYVPLVSVWGFFRCSTRAGPSRLADKNRSYSKTGIGTVASAAAVPELRQAQRLSAASKVASAFMRAGHTHSKRPEAFQFTASLQEEEKSTLERRDIPNCFCPTRTNAPQSPPFAPTHIP